MVGRHGVSTLTNPRSTRIARAIWLALAVAGTVLYFVGPISQWGTLQTVCRPDSACLPFQLDPTAASTLARYRISLSGFAVLTGALLVVIWAVWYGLSAIIIIRKPGDRGALLAAFFLAVFPIWEASAWIPSGPLSSWLTGIFVPMLLIFGLLFPDGRFAPRWTRLLAGLIVLYFVVTSFPLSFPAVVNDAAEVVFISFFCLVVGAQVYRYRAISTQHERQQTKWASVGLAVAILGLAAAWVGPDAAAVPTNNGSLFAAAFGDFGIAAIVSAVPICIGFAVLRGGLWDIDRIISRALSYTILTAALAAVYVGSVIALQALSQLLVGGGSDIAIAVSTLAIAALFRPLRSRVQMSVDRRFYRSRYDAERILAGLGEHLRDQVDLTQLSRDLTLAIQETLHPEHISLWIRDTGDADPLSRTAGSSPRLRPTTTTP